MLFKPVYIKAVMKKEAPIPMRKPPTPEPPEEPEEDPPQPPEPPQAVVIEEEESKERIPLLICGEGITGVFPKEATRDVLAGRVDYFLIDERGVTHFQRKHLFLALKLDKDKIQKIEDYPCIGAHQRLLDRKPKERRGLGYRRRYISPELIGRGIYVSQ